MQNDKNRMKNEGKDVSGATGEPSIEEKPGSHALGEAITFKLAKRKLQKDSTNRWLVVGSILCLSASLGLSACSQTNRETSQEKKAPNAEGEAVNFILDLNGTVESADGSGKLQKVKLQGDVTPKVVAPVTSEGKESSGATSNPSLEGKPSHGGIGGAVDFKLDLNGTVESADGSGKLQKVKLQGDVTPKVVAPATGDPSLEGKPGHTGIGGAVDFILNLNGTVESADGSGKLQKVKLQGDVTPKVVAPATGDPSLEGKPGHTGIGGAVDFILNLNGTVESADGSGKLQKVKLQGDVTPKVVAPATGDPSLEGKPGHTGIGGAVDFILNLNGTVESADGSGKLQKVKLQGDVTPKVIAPVK